MNVGLSLPVAYLADLADTAICTLYRKAFGQANACLASVKDNGVSSIEIRSVGLRVEPRTVALAAERILSHGLDMTIHGCLPEQPTRCGFCEMYPQLTDVVNHVLGGAQSTIITVHAYTASSGDVSAPAAKTIDSLCCVAEAIGDQQLPVKVALELNRQGQAIDPGTTYRCLVDIMDKVDNETVGLCWDFGHGYVNVSNGLLDPLPPTRFLKNVMHTHIHDIGPDGRTHWPLTQGVVPVANYVGLLATSGYEGLLNLELSLERFSGDKSACEAAGLTAASIDVLRALTIGPGI